MRQKDIKLTYTIFPEDCGLGWLWVKDVQDETMYVGSMIADSEYWYGKQIISNDLEKSFRDWYGKHGQITAKDSCIDSFNWDDFNKCGINLATCLQAELGSHAVVIYRKSPYDSSSNIEEAIAIQQDLSVRPIKLLWWCPC